MSLKLVDRLSDVVERGITRFRQSRLFQRKNAAPKVPEHAWISAPMAMQEGDPLLAYLEQAGTAVDVEQVPLPEAASPALRAARASGVTLLVPLISQGELVAVLSLGEQMSEREYSREDRELLNLLATQAAPAFVVGELVREREEEARLRERDEQEMRIAHQIQLALLPKVLPQVRDWLLTPLYKPARAVGGDFYDFIDLPDNKLGIFIGDVSSKGVPAALLMATTRTTLRSIARRQLTPAEVMQRANDLLVQEMPHGMFVTCLYGVLDYRTGEFVFANAGHLMPFHRIEGDGKNQVVEIKARGMPLGLMPGMQYEETCARLQPGDEIVFYSDGLIEAHNKQGEMFGWQRAQVVIEAAPIQADLNQLLLDALLQFVGADWEQEDDITLVMLAWERALTAPAEISPALVTAPTQLDELLLDIDIPSVEGNERIGMTQVESAIDFLHLPQLSKDRIGTAVGEAMMNAMEHGNRYQPDKPARLRVWLARSHAQLIVRISDYGAFDLPDLPAPNLDAKLSGLQTPRGWGLFLIRNMVDELRHLDDDGRHTIELRFNLPELDSGALTQAKALTADAPLSSKS